jgi:3-oxoacyl-[acyl-carrier protein] reductase
LGLDHEIANAFSLEGRVAVITGAASGLGREAARVFAKAGARVLLADLNPDGLEAAAAQVREAGGEAVIQKTDVSARDQIEALAEAAVRECGRLDIWVNSAGIPLWAGILDAPTEAAERLVAINMMGTYWGCAAAGRIMKERGAGGAIVNVSSTAGDSPVPGLSVYGMSKAGVNQLTRVAAKEFGPFGVRVNAVVPGWIDTPINASQYRDAAGRPDPSARAKVIEAMQALSPLGMTGEAVDIAMALLYLASDASRFVTGQCLRVSGGV